MLFQPFQRKPNFSWNWIRINPFKTSGHCMYRQFNIHKFYVLATQCTYVCILCGAENKQQLFPCAALTDWFVL
jgi:hypothetical protein